MASKFELDHFADSLSVCGAVTGSSGFIETVDMSSIVAKFADAFLLPFRSGWGQKKKHFSKYLKKKSVFVCIIYT